jgi:cell division protein FtsX
MDWNIILMVVAIILSLPSVCVSIYTLADKLAEQRQPPNRRSKLMECTQQEFLDALKESGREGWTLRLMTSLRNDG